MAMMMRHLWCWHRDWDENVHDDTDRHHDSIFPAGDGGDDDDDVDGGGVVMVVIVLMTVKLVNVEI